MHIYCNFRCTELEEKRMSDLQVRSLRTPNSSNVSCASSIFIGGSSPGLLVLAGHSLMPCVAMSAMSAAVASAKYALAHLAPAATLSLATDAS
jgi:hypothetical protein